MTLQGVYKLSWPTLRCLEGKAGVDIWLDARINRDLARLELIGGKGLGPLDTVGPLHAAVLLTEEEAASADFIATAAARMDAFARQVAMEPAGQVKGSATGYVWGDTP